VFASLLVVCCCVLFDQIDDRGVGSLQKECILVCGLHLLYRLYS